MLNPNEFRHVVITPLRDESKFIPELISSITSQTLLPSEWIIVDDNSTDNSKLIVNEFTKRFPWMSCYSITNGGKRKRGKSIAKLFNFGLSKVDVEWDFCSKIDADMILPSDYFEKILHNFSEDNSLGIASGSCFVVSKRGVEMDEFVFGNHTRGGLKTYRKNCFSEIGGVLEVDGWDGVDRIIAEKNGWKSRNFPKIRVEHRRKTGSYDGVLKGCYDSGSFSYCMGYYPPFFLARSIHRMLRKPYFIGGIFMILGYIAAITSRKPKSLDKESISFLRTEQRSILRNWKKFAFKTNEK